ALLDAAADFVLTLPEGLDTHCTESGGGLSEGQAQRVCIARALLRDAPILLFDESTSSLDAQTETRVIENIVNHHRGKTMLFITHRPKVLEYCTQRLDLSQSMATE
ncbi:MAG: ATP-binding cassette domain-containing protein, partial [Bacteroidaceae bacterium]|nr:ATP-binding cassette domain-containing protein [Bacteroidaceae bacterium]